MSVTTLSQRKLENIVDELGLLKAQIAELRETEKLLQAELIGTEQSRIEGKLFQAAIIEAKRQTVDVKALRETFGEKFLQPYLKTKYYTAVRVSARSES